MGEFLLPEVSNFDYIVQITGKFDDKNMKTMLEGMKRIEEVVLSAEIPLRKIKSKERLVYLEEKPVPARFKGLSKK